MLTLSLLRHAKSSWDDDSLADFDRPLAPRGVDAAPRMAAYMKRKGIVPDLVLCSASARTRETLGLVLEVLGSAPETKFERALYLASPRAMLARLRKVKDGVGHVLMVGHNPGHHALALDLVGKGKPADITALGEKFPTAGLAVIDFDVARWADVGTAAGRLRLFMTPKRLG